MSTMTTAGDQGDQPYQHQHRSVTAAAAQNLVYAIEQGWPEQMIGEQTRALVWALGGSADISAMTPGAAAIYLHALMLAHGIR